MRHDNRQNDQRSGHTPARLFRVPCHFGSGLAQENEPNLTAHIKGRKSGGDRAGDIDPQGKRIRMVAKGVEKSFGQDFVFTPETSQRRNTNQS